MHKINKLLALFFFLLHCCLHRKCLRSRIWSKRLPALNKKSMSTITLRPTCRTKRNLRRIDHGCIFTDCSTSLCSRMFSNICSLVESWLWAPSPPIEMPVLWKSQAFDSHCVSTSFQMVVFWFDGFFTYSPELLVYPLDRRRSPFTTLAELPDMVLMWAIWLEALVRLGLW